MNKVILLLILSISIASGGPEREKGISLHMLPDRVAKLSGKKGGFTFTDTRSIRDGVTYYRVRKVISIIDKYRNSVKENGVWIVYSHPSAYSSEEKNKLTKLVEMLDEKKIRVFTCRASKIKNGNWKEGLAGLKLLR